MVKGGHDVLYPTTIYYKGYRYNLKEFENSKENKVRVITTKNRNIQGILDNGFGKQYYYKDAVYKSYNQNLAAAVKLLKELSVSNR